MVLMSGSFAPVFWEESTVEVVPSHDDSPSSQNNQALSAARLRQMAAWVCWSSPAKPDLHTCDDTILEEITSEI